MPAQTAIRCPHCSFQFPAKVQSVIDAAINPQGKAMLVSGVLNAFPCPNCGSPVQISVPVMFHDGSKEMLLAFIPPELAVAKPQREKIIGDMMRELTGMLPSGSFRSYMFQPRESLTMQGMIDTILEADGITPAMMAAQRERMRIIETLLSAPPETRAAIITKNDAVIDAQLVQMISVLIQRMSAQGQADGAQQLSYLQQELLQHSTFGQSLMQEAQAEQAIVEEVTNKIRALGEQATQADFVNLAIELGADEKQLQALVGVARPALDYTFFQMLTERIGRAPAAERDALQALRDQLLALTQAIDEHTQGLLQEAAELLQVFASAKDEAALDALISENTDAMDETFLSVLMANIEQAEEKQNAPLLQRLQIIYQKAMAALRQTMPPELRFINELMSAESEDKARALIRAGLKEFGPGLLGMLASVREAMQQRGEPEIVQHIERLQALAQQEAG